MSEDREFTDTERDAYVPGLCPHGRRLVVEWLEIPPYSQQTERRWLIRFESCPAICDEGKE
jgi:hypothetical protein